METHSVKADAKLSTAAKLMRDANIGLLLVADGNRLVGVVTDRDIVTRAVAEELDMNEVKVRSAMSHPVVCIRGSADIRDAATLMAEKRIRRLVVTDEEDRPVGVLSLDDLAFFTHGDETAGTILEELSHGPAMSPVFRPG